MRLLVVEDEHSLREDIARKLRLSGYEVDACADGEAALEALAAERYDLVLLDLNLPKVDGMQVLRTLRRHDLETCVLILSARSEIADKVEGLDAGANDYLSKPFHLAELDARVRSLTRRKFIQQDVCLCCGRLSFNTRSRVAAVDGQTLALTRKESGVLEYLLLHQGRPVSQEELIEHVWDGSVDSFSNSIRVHISLPCAKSCGRCWATTPSATASGKATRSEERYNETVVPAMAHHPADGAAHRLCLRVHEPAFIPHRCNLHGCPQRLYDAVSARQ